MTILDHKINSSFSVNNATWIGEDAGNGSISGSTTDKLMSEDSVSKVDIDDICMDPAKYCYYGFLVVIAVKCALVLFLLLLRSNCRNYNNEESSQQDNAEEVTIEVNDSQKSEDNKK